MKIAEVFFRGNKKPYFFKTEIEDLRTNESVVVETANGDCRVLFSKYVDIINFKNGHPTKSIIYRNRVLSNIKNDWKATDDGFQDLVKLEVVNQPKDNRQELLSKIEENNLLIKEIQLKNSELGYELGRQYKFYGRNTDIL